MTCNPEDIKDRLDKPIILIGMMGTGKTYIGRLLADSLGLPFQDSDRIIEQKAGVSIPEIFERDGEEKFRAVEAKTIRDLLAGSPQVISTGGGAPANPETLETIKAGAYSIWLSSNISDILARVSDNTNRPLLNNDNPEQTLRDLLEKRRTCYSRADIHIENAEGQASKTIEKIMDSLHNLLNSKSN